MLKGGNIVEDAIGEILETGNSVAQQVKTIPGQIVKSAMEQTGAAGSKAGEMPPGLEDLKGKSLPPEKMNALKEQDVLRSKQEMGHTRAGLQRLIIQRYQRMQNEELAVSKKKEQEEIQKQQEEIAKAQKKQQETAAQNSGPVTLHKGEKNPFEFGGKEHRKLSIFDKQKLGTGEIKSAKLG